MRFVRKVATSRGQVLGTTAVARLGFLLDNRSRKTDEGFSYSFKCAETALSQWKFNRNSCSGRKDHGNRYGVCCYCWKNRKKLFEMCRQEVCFRESKTAKKGRRDQMEFKSPSVVFPLVEELTQQIAILRAERWRLNARVKMYQDDKVDIELDGETLFDPEDLKKCYQDFVNKEIITQQDIFHYLFTECVEVGKRLKSRGTAKGHRYSGLLIQFACILRAKCSVDMYEFFRKVFNLPAHRHLCRFESADSTSPDGLMLETIIQMAEIFNRRGIPRGDFLRYVNLGWDSMVIKDLLGTYRSCFSLLL